LRVTDARSIDFDQQQIPRRIAKRDRLQIPKRAKKQAGSHHKQKRKSHLTDNKRFGEGRPLPGGGCAAACLFQVVAHGRAGGSKRRNEAEGDASQQRRTRGKGEDVQIKPSSEFQTVGRAGHQERENA